MNRVKTKIFQEDRINAVIRRLTILLRIVLIISIIISFLGLLIVVFKKGDFDLGTDAFTLFDGVIYLIILATFYSFVYGTIPGIILLLAIYLDNRFRRKNKPQPIKFETRLMLINLAIAITVGLWMMAKYTYYGD